MKRKTFRETLIDALKHYGEVGYTSEVDLQEWLIRLAHALEIEMPTDEDARRALAQTLGAIFARDVDRGGVQTRVPGVSRYTLDRIAPTLRAELDRRIYAGADLIKLNKRAAVQKTLQRFSGWVTSSRTGGPKPNIRAVAADIIKPTAEVKFQRRRVAIDQGHKLSAAVAHVVSEQHGAIAAIWHDRGERDRGYDARPEHLARSGKMFLVRDSWAMNEGLIQKGDLQYTDEIEQVAELPYCSCFYEYVVSPRALPDELLTEKGREWLEGGKVLERADARIDAKPDDPDGHWVTLHGTHVFISEDGTILKGPKAFIGKHPDEIGKTHSPKLIEGAKSSVEEEPEPHARVKLTLPEGSKAKFHFKADDFFSSPVRLVLKKGGFVDGRMRVFTMPMRNSDKKEIYAGLSKAIEAFPELKEAITDVGAADQIVYEVQGIGTDTDDQYQANTSMVDDKHAIIMVSPTQTASVTKREWESGREKNFSTEYVFTHDPKEYIRASMIHEAGHVIALTSPQSFRDSVKAEFEREKREGTSHMNWPSQYATTNDGEFFAEAFFAYVSGNAHVLPAPLKAILDERLKGQTVKLDADDDAAEPRIVSIACHPEKGKSVIRWSDGTTTTNTVDDEWVAAAKSDG